MSKYKTVFLRNRFLTTGSILVTILVAGLSIWTQLAQSSNRTGQNPDKFLEKGNDFDPPAKITLVKSYTGKIELDKRAFAGDDWLKGLKVSVLNMSDKPITHVTIELRFRRPKEQAGQLDLIHALRYGPDPFFPYDNAPANPVEPILPGQSIDISFPDDEYETVRSILAERKYPAVVKEVKLLVRVLGFSDGTAWTSGAYFKRDPQAPDKWIRLNQSQAKRHHSETGVFF